MKAIITNKHRGLYYGEISKKGVETAMKTGVAKIRNMRHISYWKGPTGGLSSLAVQGPGEGSRIGDPVGVAYLSDVCNILVCEPAAIARFEK